MNIYRENFEDGMFVTDIEVTKLDNGMFKATSCGLEANDHNQENAIAKLQQRLNDEMAQGTIHPGMNH